MIEYAADGIQKKLQLLQKELLKRYSLFYNESYRFCLLNQQLNLKKTKHKSNKFNDVGNIAFETIQAALNARDDLFIFLLTHSETVTNAQTGMPMDKMKSIGKLIISKQYIA